MRRIRTLHGNDVATLALDHLGDHVVNQAVLVPDLGGLEVLLVLAVVDGLEDILELSVVCLENGVLGAHVQRQLPVKRHLEGGVCKTGDGLGGVVLGLRDTTLCWEVVDLDNFRLAALGCVDHLKCAFAGDDAVLRTVLVAESVTADDDGLLPAGYETRDAGDDNGRAENGSSSKICCQQCFFPCSNVCHTGGCGWCRLATTTSS